METYERSVRIVAPLDAVWEFHSTAAGLEALTPGWMNLTVESIRVPDDESESPALEVGSVLELSIRPFGIGPRQEVISEISAREKSNESAYFRDIMHDGPFEKWEHTHRFVADRDETLLTDTIDYELPLGRLGSALGPLAGLGFEPMFRFRHQRTKKLLET